MKPLQLPKPEALSHVLYEIWMMVSCFELLAAKPSDAVARNLALEGFLIHARCLRGFFTAGPKQVKDDDLLPSYFEFSSELNLSGDPSYKRMHKEIAHLSHCRRDDENEKQWKFSDELEILRPTCLRFLKEMQKRPELLEYRDNNKLVSMLIPKLSPIAPTLYGLDSTTTSSHTTVISSNPAGIGRYLKKP